jgi:pimeloyl-CoA synthetase
METKEILDQVSNTIETKMPEIVEAVVEKKFALLNQKNITDLEDIKAELKKLTFSQKSTNEVIKKAMKETFIVSVMKEVVANNITSEKAFNDVANKTYSAMNTETD